MVILHDAIREIKNGFLFKEQNLSLKKQQKNELKKKNRRVVFFKKRVFLNPDYLSIPFCDFPFISRSGTSHSTTNLIGCVPHT